MSLSEAQAEQLNTQALANFADSLGITAPPKVARVRWITPSEVSVTRASCIAKAGFPATPDGNGGINFGPYPKEQTPALAMAQYVCAAEYPVHPEYGLPLSPSALGKLYDWYVSVSVPCLRSLKIETDPAPSKTTWVAQSLDQESGAGDGDVWYPYSHVSAGTPPSNINQIEQQCPQTPPFNVYLEHTPSLDGG